MRDALLWYRFVCRSSVDGGRDVLETYPDIDAANRRCGG